MKETDPHEIEAKFSAPDASSLSRLLDLDRLDEFRLSAAKEVQVTDRYFDTPEGSLRAQGFVCRVREFPNGAELALKSRGEFDDGVHRRLEIESALPKGLEPSEWPKSNTRKRIEELVDLKRLRPIATLQQNRKTRKLRKGRTVSAELSLDEVTPIGKNGPGKMYEVEIELSKKGLERDLEKLSAVLAPMGLKPQKTSKLERFLESAPVKPKDEKRKKSKAKSKKGLFLDPDRTMRQAGLASIRYHSKRLLKHEKGTRKGKDIEDLHGMRVATRRLRAAAKLFGDYLPPKPLKKLNAGLGNAGKAMGKARDYDVLLVNLDRYEKELSPAGKKALQPLATRWKKERRQARTDLLEFLNGADYRKLKKVCKEFKNLKGLENGNSPENNKAEPNWLRYAIPRLLWEEYESVRCYEPVLEGAPVETYHALRIECKRLRYSLEFFKDLLGQEGPSLVQAVVAAQEHLGETQDADVAEKLLEGILQKNKWPKKTREAIQGYRDACRSRKLDRIQNFAQVWSGLIGDKFRKHLAEAVSVL